MSTTWTDDFSHDHFADSTYVLQDPTSTYTLAPGSLRPDSESLVWADPRHVISGVFVSVRVWIDLTAMLNTVGGTDVAFLQLFSAAGDDGCGGGLTGGSDGLHLDLETRRSNVLVSQVNRLSLSPPSGHIELTLDASGLLTLATPGDSAEITIAPADLAAWLAAGLRPGVWLSNDYFSRATLTRS